MKTLNVAADNREEAIGGAERQLRAQGFTLEAVVAVEEWGTCSHKAHVYRVTVETGFLTQRRGAISPSASWRATAARRYAR